MSEAGRLDVLFHGVNYSAGDTQILKDVYGGVEPGQIMAVMGPSGGWWLFLFLLVYILIFLHCQSNTVGDTNCLLTNIR